MADPGVHDDRNPQEDAGDALLGRKAVEKALEGLLAAPVGHVQHSLFGPARVVDDRHVLVPLLERRLVDGQRLWQLDGPPRESSRHCSDCVQLVQVGQSWPFLL